MRVRSSGSIRAPLKPRSLLLALTLALLSLACGAPGGGRRFATLSEHAPRAREFDVLAYRIELELLPETRSIQACCRVRLRALEQALDTVRLDLVGLEVQDARDERGRVLSFTRSAGELTLELAAPLAAQAETELAIRYGGRPERGLWFAGQRADGSGPTLVFSHGQTQGSRGWFPCFDEPDERATAELTLTMPAAWSSVAPGERSDVVEQNGRRTETWRCDFPHPSYLTSLVAGEFTRAEARAGEVPLLFLAEPRFADWIAPTFAESADILDFLAEYSGVAYPYPKYSQAAVDNFPWGGMENLSATTLTPLLLGDVELRRDQAPFYLLAHEAAHQWFGDFLTCADWSHLWLNEGFATYCTLLYLEHSRGVDDFRAEVRETQEAYLNQDVGGARRPTVWSRWKEPDDVFDTRAYQGAAARLHLLRFVLGDEGFQAGVRLYVSENRGRGVVTADLQRAFERATSRDLVLFFEQWLARPGFPEFALDWNWDADARAVELNVEQVQEPEDGTPAVFALPVEIELGTRAGSRFVRVELDERRERFEFPCAEEPRFVRFDAHGWIPKRVDEDKPLEEWLAIAEACEDVNARRESALVLGRAASGARADDPERERLRAALVARLEQDDSAWVRADAAAALGLARGDEARAALERAALEDGEARVRSAALYALRAFGPDERLALVAEEAFGAGFSYQTMAAAAALLCCAAPARGFDFVRAGLELDSPHDVLAGRLLRHLAELSDARVPAELRRWAADPALAPTARAVAVECLGGLNRERPATGRFLVPFLDEESFHLRLATVKALANFGDEGARRALAAYYPRTRTAAERRVIEELLERSAR